MIGKPEQGQHLLDKQRVEKGRLAFHTPTEPTPASLQARKTSASSLLVRASTAMVAEDAIFFFGQPVPRQHGHSRLPIFVVLSDSPGQQARMLCFRGFMFIPALHPNGARPVQTGTSRSSGQSTPSIGSGAGSCHCLDQRRCVGCEVLEDTVDCLHQKRAGRWVSSSKGHRRRAVRRTCINFFDQLRCTTPPAINGPAWGSPTSKTAGRHQIR